MPGSGVRFKDLGQVLGFRAEPSPKPWERDSEALTPDPRKLA